MLYLTSRHFELPFVPFLCRFALLPIEAFLPNFVKFYSWQEHMIENEILILRRVKHKHIVELIEEFETPKEILLVMELVPVRWGLVK